jgi:hypothetical protein
VDNGVFTFQANSESVKRIRLNQFIFANAYLGADPMSVIHAMEAGHPHPRREDFLDDVS